MREIFPLVRPPLYYNSITKFSRSHRAAFFYPLKSSIVAPTVAAIFIIIHHRVSFIKVKNPGYTIIIYKGHVTTIFSPSDSPRYFTQVYVYIHPSVTLKMLINRLSCYVTGCFSACLPALFV